MKSKKILLVFITTISCLKIVVSQTTFSKSNNKYIDSIEQMLKSSLCQGIIKYPDKYQVKRIESDKIIFNVLNAIFQKGANVNSLDIESNNYNNVMVSRKDRVNGLIRVISITLKGNYVRAELKLECINDLVFRKKCLLFSTSKGRCTESGFSTLDFNLFKAFFLKKMDFEVSVSDYDHLVATDFIIDNLKIASSIYKEFKFNLPNASNEEWVNVFLNNQYNNDSSCYYSFSKVDKGFVNLILRNKIDLLKQLLYSPNYFYSIQSMEALIYLTKIGRIVVNDPERVRMEAIRQSEYEITVRKSPDLFITVNNYKGLSVTDSEITQKYQLALRESGLSPID